MGAAPWAHPLFKICDDVLARSFQTAFRSEHWSERLNAEYSMDCPVGFLRFGEGTLATYGPETPE